MRVSQKQKLLAKLIAAGKACIESERLLHDGQLLVDSENVVEISDGDIEAVTLTCNQLRARKLLDAARRLAFAQLEDGSAIGLCVDLFLLYHYNHLRSSDIARESFNNLSRAIITPQNHVRIAIGAFSIYINDQCHYVGNIRQSWLTLVEEFMKACTTGQLSKLPGPKPFIIAPGVMLHAKDKSANVKNYLRRVASTVVDFEASRWYLDDIVEWTEGWDLGSILTLKDGTFETITRKTTVALHTDYVLSDGHTVEGFQQFPVYKLTVPK